MLIDYWECKWPRPEHENVSDIDNPDYKWRYYCDHPDNKDSICHCDNKYEEEDDCEFIGNKVFPD